MSEQKMRYFHVKYNLWFSAFSIIAYYATAILFHLVFNRHLFWYYLPLSIFSTIIACAFFAKSFQQKEHQTKQKYKQLGRSIGFLAWAFSALFITLVSFLQSSDYSFMDFLSIPYTYMMIFLFGLVFAIVPILVVGGIAGLTFFQFVTKNKDKGNGAS